MNKQNQLLKSISRVFKAIIPALLGFVVLVAIIAWLSGAFRTKIEPGQTGATVAKYAGEPTDVVHEITKDYIEEAVGTLKAASRTEISAQLLATIDEIAVTAGDVVNEGDLLVRLNSREFDARLRQAEEALRSAEAAYQNAEIELARARSLLESNAISRASFDQRQTTYQVTAAERSRAEEAVAEARVLLSYTTIKAPKAGRVVDKLASVGDTASPGRPLLVTYDATSLRLEAPVLEKLAVSLKVGDRLTVHVDAIDRDVEAVIDEIVPQADAPSRSFLVKASVPRRDDLYEGMFGRLLIPAGQRRHLCLATDAIENVGQLEFVTVVRPDQTVERRLIKTGRLGMPGRVEVLSGVSAGETVILRRTSDDHTSSRNDTP